MLFLKIIKRVRKKLYYSLETWTVRCLLMCLHRSVQNISRNLTDGMVPMFIYWTGLCILMKQHHIFMKDCMGVFDEVKERVTAREVMERAGIVFNRNNMCRCPFHQDKTASMKVKPTDKKYFCFGCGEKGDAIDFVAKYYNRSPREAAMQIADEFGIIYDSSVRSPPKPVRREKSPMQILEETKTKTYRVLSDYLHLLKEWERNFRPESMEKIDERYVEAVQNREKVEFQLDTLLWGTEDEKEAVIHDLGKGVEDIERRVREYRRNQGTVNHNRQRSCEAVH